MTDEAKAMAERANWRTTGEQQVADELREISKEVPCGQRQMHLEIAAQIVEQGQFLHPDNFAMAIELDEANALIETQAREIERLNAILSDMNDTDIIARTMAENKRLRMHLDVALETLVEEGVCDDDCNSCKEARAALAGDSHGQ